MVSDVNVPTEFETALAEAQAILDATTAPAETRRLARALAAAFGISRDLGDLYRSLSRQAEEWRLAATVDCGGCVERGVVACETCDDCKGARRVPAVDEIARLHRENAYIRAEFKRVCELNADNFEAQLTAFVDEAKRIANDWRPMPSARDARAHAKAHPSPLGDGWSAWFCRTKSGLVSMVHMYADLGSESTIANCSGSKSDDAFRPATANGDGAAWPAVATQEAT